MWLPAGENPAKVDLPAYMKTMLNEAGKLDLTKAPETAPIRGYSKKMVATLNRELTKIQRNLLGHPRDEPPARRDGRRRSAPRAHRRQGSPAHGRDHGGADRHRQRPRHGRSADPGQRRQHPLDRADPGQAGRRGAGRQGGAARRSSRPRPQARPRPPANPAARRRRTPNTGTCSSFSQARPLGGALSRAARRERAAKTTAMDNEDTQDHEQPITAAEVNELRERTSRPDDGVQGRPDRGRRRHGEGRGSPPQEGTRRPRRDRETAEGRIAVSIDPAKQVGAMVEVLLRERPGRQERAVRRAGQRPGQAGRPRGRSHARGSCWPRRSSATRRRRCRTASARSSASSART